MSGGPGGSVAFYRLLTNVSPHKVWWAAAVVVVVDCLRSVGSALSPGVNPASALSLPAAAASLDTISLLKVPLWSSSPHSSLLCGLQVKT